MSADSKLRARLTDPARSGAYRVSSDRDIRDALGAGDVDLVKVSLALLLLPAVRRADPRPA